MHLRTAWFAPAALLLTCQHAAPVPVSAGAEPTGIAAFTLDPTLITAKVSPKGTYLATLSEESGRRSLTFVNLATHKVTYVLRPEGESTIGPVLLGKRRAGGDPDGRARELPGRAGLAGRNLRAWTRPAAAGAHLRVSGGRTAGRLAHRKAAAERAWGFVIDTLRNDPKHVLIEETSMDEKPGRPNGRNSKLDVYSGLKTRVAVSPIAEASFLTDENGELRIAEGPDTDAKPPLLLLRGGAGLARAPLHPRLHQPQQSGGFVSGTPSST